MNRLSLCPLLLAACSVAPAGPVVEWDSDPTQAIAVGHTVRLASSWHAYGNRSTLSQRDDARTTVRCEGVPCEVDSYIDEEVWHEPEVFEIRPTGLGWVTVTITIENLETGEIHEESHSVRVVVPDDLELLSWVDRDGRRHRHEDGAPIALKPGATEAELYVEVLARHLDAPVRFSVDFTVDGGTAECGGTGCKVAAAPGEVEVRAVVSGVELLASHPITE